MGFICAIFLSIGQGAVALLLWRWFVVPPFNAPRLNLGYAIGICMLAELLTWQTPNPNEGRTLEHILYYQVVGTLTILAFGWVAHFFV